MRYRLKERIVEAAVWNKHGDHPRVFACNHLEASKDCAGYMVRCEVCGAKVSYHGHIETPIGDDMVFPGDWIIRTDKDEYYAVRAERFVENYEPID